MGRVDPAEKGAQDPEPLFSAPEFTVWCDVSMTRRKHFHIIMDASEQVVFRDRLFGPVLEWLRDQGITRYMLCTSPAYRRRSICQIIETKEP